MINRKMNALAMLLVAGAPLVAQTTTGNLSGLVKDHSGKPITGAKVILEAPELMRPRICYTDAKGRYRAALLPVGNYSIKVVASGFQGRGVSGIRVGIGAEAQFDFSLLAEAVMEARVEVVDSAAVQESITKAVVSQNLSMETLKTLAVTRDVNSVLALTPGFLIGANAGIRGSINTMFSLNGIEVSDPKFSSSRMYETVADAIEDVEVILSPVHPRYGRATGGLVNTVTKSGSNEFGGSLTINASRPSWMASRFGSGVPASNLTSLQWRYTDDLTRTYDYTFGGPILKDRVWFFLSGKSQPDSATGTTSSLKSFSKQDVIWATNPVSPLWTLTSATGLATHASAAIDNYLLQSPSGYTLGDTMDAGATYGSRTKQFQVDGKITAALTSTQMLIASAFLNRQTSVGSGPSVINTEFIGKGKKESSGFSLSWKGTFGSNLSAEANFSKSDRETRPFTGPTTNPVTVIGHMVGSYSAGLTSQDRLTSLGSASLLRSTTPDYPEGSGTRKFDFNIKYFLDFHGSHDLDLGMESVLNYDKSGQSLGANNSIVYVGGWYHQTGAAGLDAGSYLFPTVIFSGLDRWGNLRSSSGSAWGDSWAPDSVWTIPVGPAPVMMVGSVSASRGETKNSSFWLSDGWTVNQHLHVMMGLRYNLYSGKANTGLRIDNLGRLDPRLMVKWDPDGNGRNYFSFTLARYSQEFAVNYFGSGGLSASPYTNGYLVGWKGISGQSALPWPYPTTDITNPGDYVKLVTYQQLIDINNYDTTHSIMFRDDKTRTKVGDMVVPYSDEMAVNYTRAIPGGSVRASVARKIYRKDWVSYQDHGLLDYYSQAVDPLGSGSKLGYAQNTYWTNNPYKTTFDSCELGWNQSLTERLYWGGSLTITRRDVEKDFASVYNYRYIKALNGLDASNEDLYVPKGVTSEMKSAKVFFSYRVPVQSGSVSFGLNGNYYMPNILAGSSNPGRTQYSYATWPDLTAAAGTSSITQAYRGTYSTYFLPSGAFHETTEAYSNWDFKIAFEAPLGYKKARLTASLMIYNILNQAIWDPMYPVSGDYPSYGSVPAGYLLRNYASSSKLTIGSRGENSSLTSDFWNSQPRRAGEITVGVRF